MILVALIPIAQGCNDDESMRAERVEKLRAIGVSSSPLVLPAPGPGATGSIELTAFAALPKGESVSASSFLDEASTYTPVIPVTVDPASATTTSYAALDVYSVKANVTVGPLTAEQEATLALTGKLTFRYGIHLESGTESEDIVGNVLVYPAGSPEVAFQPLSVNVAEPLANAIIGTGPDQKLTGTIARPQEESVKVSWFVSSGKVTNRRARDTSWEPGKTGAQTVIMTARGLKSGSFAMKAVDVTAQ